MDKIVSFEQGLNLDLSKSIQPKNTYTDALNVQLTTDDGGTTGALINFKGNQSFVTVNDTYASYKILLNGTVDTDPLTINGSASAGTFTTSATSTGLDLYNFIIADANLIAAGLGSAWNVAYGANFVIVWGISLNPSPTSVHLGFTITTHVAAQTNLDVIGWGKIREDLVLFTTNVSNSTGGVGQIWKLTYDKSTVKNSSGSPTLTLIYNNDITVTKQKPICQENQTEGRYENSTTQRIYWTDNFNRLRKLNIADPQAMALDSTELDVQTPVSFSSAFVLQSINDTGGVLKSGMYAYAYRLTNSTGASTIFSEPSIWHPVYVPLSSVGYENQVFGPVNVATSKSLTFEATSLDTDFDRIQVVALFRTSSDGIPDINIILDEPIPSSGIFNFTHTGSEDTIPVTLEEYTAYASTFTHCKTIESKDNILFAANLRNEAFDVTYDARAFRFRSSNGAEAGNARIATLTGSGATTIDGAAPVWPGLTIDAIQAYSVQTTRGIGGQRFQTDGVTLGGEGKSIKYSFTTTTHHTDATPATFNTTSSPYGYLSRIVNADTTPYTINSISYPMTNYSANKSPYRHCLLKGYQREEMYRFGIVFYDRNGSPSPVKWIGDIVMPSMFEPNNAYVNTTTFVIGDTSGYTSWAQAKNLGILFTVDLSTASISAADRKKITAFSIVRVKRDEDNKRIKGAGILYPCLRSSASAATFIAPNGEGLSNTYSVTVGETLSNDTKCATLCSPDFNDNVSNFKGFSTSDELRTVAIAAAVTSSIASGINSARFKKNYTFAAPTTRQELVLEQAEMCTVGESNAATIVNGGGGPFHNFTKTDLATVPAQSHSIGNNTLFLETDTGTAIDYDVTNGIGTGSSSKLYAYYYRPLTSQYGGNTYSQRANSEYMFCNHVQPVDSTTTSYAVTIYGGDVFINSYDYQQQIANWKLGTGPPAFRISTTTWFHVESTVNTDLNYDPTVNKTGLTLTAAGIDYYGEVYYTADCLKAESDVRQYYPLPVSFNSTTEFDNRVAFSEVKINGETTDSWGIFKTNNFYDVEGIHGPINSIMNVKDTMHFWQPLGFGALSINPVSIVQDLSGAAVQLGVGDVIQKHDYITIEGGSKHTWGMSRGPDSVYWFDAIKRKIWKYSGEGLTPLSDIKGMHGWFNETLRGKVLTEDNPVYQNSTTGSENGVCSTYDFENNRLYMTFLDSTVNTAGDVWTTVKNTLTYNEQFDCFESFHSFYPSMYINDGHIILTRNPTSSSTYKNLFIHSIGNYGSYYGTVYDSTIEIVANEHPTTTKVFDNLEWHTEVVDKTGTNPVNVNNLTWDRLRVYNDHQNSDWRTLVVDTDLKRRERSWRVACPRNRVLYTSSASPNIFTDLNTSNKTYEERIRDKYAVIGLKFSNSNNRSLVFHWLKYLFRISPR